MRHVPRGLEKPKDAKAMRILCSACEEGYVEGASFPALDIAVVSERQKMSNLPSEC